MKYSKQNPPLVCMMTNSTCYKSTHTMTVKGVLWHSTGANNSNLRRYVQPSPNDPNYNELMRLLGTNTNRNSWNQQYVEAGVNFWIGKLADGSVSAIQTMPWNYRPWGCAGGWRGSANDSHVQFEICEDALSDRAYFDKVYQEACEMTAYICDLYDLDPYGYTDLGYIKVPVIMCHKDSYNLGVGSNHSDVYHWFNRYGKTMEDVRDDVAAIMKGASKPSTPTVQPTPTPSIPSVDKKETIEVNDVVEIDLDATYYSGKRIPDWVINTDWIVKSVSGDRVVIDKSVDGKYQICSPVNAKYLTVVKSGSASTTKPIENTAAKIIVPNITYAVKTKEHGILPDVRNREDYAGYENSEIVAIKISVDSGSVKYRAHTVNGVWLDWITEANWKDYNNGYAGDDKTAIDAIEVIYYTDTKQTGGSYYKAKYQVRGKGNTACWANQLDNETKNGQDGYAGAFGVPIVEVRMSLYA